jgi:hypothetical protein
VRNSRSLSPFLPPSLFPPSLPPLPCGPLFPPAHQPQTLDSHRLQPISSSLPPYSPAAPPSVPIPVLSLPSTLRFRSPLYFVLPLFHLLQFSYPPRSFVPPLVRCYHSLTSFFFVFFPSLASLFFLDRFLSFSSVERTQVFPPSLLCLFSLSEHRQRGGKRERGKDKGGETRKGELR